MDFDLKIKTCCEIFHRLHRKESRRMILLTWLACLSQIITTLVNPSNSQNRRDVVAFPPYIECASESKCDYNLLFQGYIHSKNVGAVSKLSVRTEVGPMTKGERVSIIRELFCWLECVKGT